MTATLTSKFSEALTYAAAAHAGQTRRGTAIPYLAHCLSVAALALEAGCDEETAIAALLHDVVEDCGGPPRLSEIREQFGEVVAATVSACSDTDQTPKPPWKARKQAWLEAFPRMPPAAQLVSTCDKLHNARAIVGDLYEMGEVVWQKFNGGREGTLWYYATFVNLCRETTLPSALVEYLRRVVETMRVVANAGGEKTPEAANS